MGMDIYQAGAEALWGSGEHIGEGSAYEAGVDARALTEEALTMRDKVRDALKTNPNAYPREFIYAFNQWLTSWADFVRRVSGVDIPVWNLPKQAGAWITVRWYGAEIFNAVQDYRTRFNKLWAIGSRAEGKDITPIRPPDPKPKVSTNPVKDTMADIVKGVVIVAATIVGGYALINWVGKPKTRVITQPSADVAVIEE